MSSTSCYDDSPSEYSEDSNADECDDHYKIVISQMQLVACRYEKWHKHFLRYSEILKHLVKLTKFYQPKVIVKFLGYSRENRPICLVDIKPIAPAKTYFSVMVEAGSNGNEKMTVSSAIYLIDYLTKTKQTIKIRFLIIPCLNPDAYERCLTGEKISKNNREELDITKRFPKNLIMDSTTDVTDSITNPPMMVHSNCKMLMEALEKYKQSLGLFISLQATENCISYPLDNYFKEMFDFALICKKKMHWDGLKVKQITPALTEKYGTSVEHVVRNYNHLIKFAYILNVHNKNFKPKEKFILTKGNQILSGVLVLSRMVCIYRFTKSPSKIAVETITAKRGAKRSDEK